ncbi:MAG: carboxymuconolactone decarboxylase family protein [Sphaerochaetaceae bacterium]
MKKIIPLLLVSVVFLSACSSSQHIGSINPAPEETEQVPNETLLFELGQPNPLSNYFTGNTYLDLLVSNDDVFNMPSMFNVSFEPRARTDWHSHDGGQILIVTYGVGYYQEEGETINILRPGDVVMIEPDVKHWHGASPESWFSHIAISTNPGNSATVWMEPVSGEDYNTSGVEEFGNRVEKNLPQDALENMEQGAILPLGQPNPLSDYFTGNTYLALLVAPDEMFNCPPMFNVTFEPGARTDWHSHDGGQILIAIGGVGSYQIEGKPIETLHSGDVVMVDPGVKHWHGASPDSWFSHIAISTNPGNSATNWMEPVTDAIYFANEPDHEKTVVALAETDPDLADIMNNFLYEEIYKQSDLLTMKERDLISIVSLVTQGSDGLLRDHVTKVLDNTLSPIEIKEAVYQCVPYIGFPRAIDAIEIINEIFAEKGISLPLASQTTVTDETRFMMGSDAQATIFGEGMRAMAAAGPDAIPRTFYYLISNCFGDYYTRDGLDLATREMLTLAILCNLGTESQLRSHILGNVSMGKDKATITEVMYQCLPYMGYPRFLNATGYLNAVLPDEGV